MKIVDTLLSGAPPSWSLSASALSRRNLLLVSASALAAACSAPAPAPVATAASSAAEATSAPPATTAAVAPAAAPAQATTTSTLDKILSAQKIRIGTNLLSKPYTFKNEAGEADGWDTDIGKAVAADMGVQPEFVDTPWDGIIPALQADKFDVIIAAMANTVKRSLTVNFTIPYHMVGSALYYRAADAAKFSSLDTFNDPSLTVGSELGGAHKITLERFFPQLKVTEFNTIAEVLLAMETNKVDLAIAEYTLLSQHASEREGFAVRAVDYPGSQFPIAMALLSGLENDHLKNFLNLWIQQFYWTAQYEPVRKKWFPDLQPLQLGKFPTPL